MKKTFILVLCLSMFIGQRSVLAKPMEIEEKLFQETLQQSKNVTGLLTDEYGNPIIGATILVKGTTQGVISDINGRFSIRVAVGETLSFSFIGYENVEKKVTSETEVFNIRMIEESTSLKDVVIVGFGKQKKASVVGAISSVKPESFKLPTSSLSASLAGRMSGVIAVQRSGEPGGDGADFWIRGIGTNGANSAPLILLDGVEISSGDLNDIQPDDIQSFSILKDASATALYGVRGANGVMIVTTKEGATNEKISVKARLENSWSMPSYHLDMVDGPTYMRMYNEALKNDDPNTSPMYSEDRIQGTIKGLNRYIYPNVDWQKEIFKNVTMNQRANINISGGSKIASYYVSAGIYRDTGIMKNISQGSFNNNIDNKRYNFQANINANVTKTTKVSLKLSTVIDDKNSPVVSAADTYRNIIQKTNPVNFPIMFPAGSGPLGNETNILYGNMSFNGATFVNPYAELAKGYSTTFSSTVISTFELKQDLSMLAKGLSARALFSYKNWNTAKTDRSTVPFYYQISKYNPTDYTYTLEKIGTTGSDYLSFSKANNGDRTIYWEAAIDYQRLFGKNNITAMLLYNQRQYNPAFPSSLFDAVPYRTTGLAGRFTYAYDERYFAEFNFGYNGTENFIKDRQFGFFPSIALGYSISNEDFFKPLRSVVTALKIRGSYGLVGNDKIAGARFPYLTEISLGTGPNYHYGENMNTWYSGITFTRIGNEQAKWEVGYKANVGIDMEILGSLNLTIDYFTERRTGIFQQPATLPSSMGFGSTIPYYNLGEVKNSGIDASFTYNKAVNKDFTISLLGNIVYAHNKIIKDQYPEQIYSNLSHIGHPINSIYGLTASGLYGTQEEIDHGPVQQYGSGPRIGDIKYVDITSQVDGKNIVNDNDKHVIGSPTVPEITYGFGGTIRYKKFDFGIFFQGVARTSFILSAGNMAPFGRWNANVAQWIADDYWSESNPNPKAQYPRLSAIGNENNHQNSTYWLRDGSFLKLKSLEFGYSMKYLRFYVNGTNLLTFSNFKLWDPEMGGNGYYQYPTQRVFNIGIQFNFN